MPSESARPEELLTPRQLEVLELLAKGLTNSEIADVLGIAAGTAKNHVAAVLEALDVSNRTEAVGLLGELEEKAEATPERAIPGFGRRPALAVLPLDNLGPPEDDYIADGLVEDLTTALAAWRWFPVIARNSTFAYKGRGVDVREVSRQLGARYVLEGSARRAGDRLRVHVQLIDGETGEHHWAHRYDHTLDDLFVVQDEIVCDIVGALEPTLARIERMRALRRPQEDMDAWAELQRGLHLLWRQQIGDPLKAEVHLRRATEIEPGGAAGWAALSQCQCMWAVWGGCDDPLGWLARGEESARRAIELDPMDFAGHLGLGASLGLRGKIEEATRALEMACSLNPSCAQAYFGLGALSLGPGQQEQAALHCEKAIRLSPRDPMLHHFHGVRGAALFWLGDYGAALLAVEASMAAEPSDAFSFRPLRVACLARLGRLEEARQVRDEVLAISPHFTLAPSRALGHGELVEALESAFALIDWHPD